MTKINPFKPNSPVPIGMFAGRLREIEALEKGLHQTKNGNPDNFLIIGERGIGKSSLLTLMKPLASGEIETFKYGFFNFVTVNVQISERTSLVTFIKLIERQIQREIGKLKVIKSFLKETWNFVQRIKVLDSGIDQADKTEDADLVIDDFAYSLAETSKRITNPLKGEEKKDGIIFFIDEADNASPDLHIGYYFKVITELLQQYGCNNIMFVVAGLPDVVDKLSKSHESSIRVFTQLH